MVWPLFLNFTYPLLRPGCRPRGGRGGQLILSFPTSQPLPTLFLLLEMPLRVLS